MKDKLKDKEEKFAATTEYRENLKQTIQALQEQVQITEQFEEDQDLEAMKAKLGGLVKNTRSWTNNRIACRNYCWRCKE